MTKQRITLLPDRALRSAQISINCIESPDHNIVARLAQLNAFKSSWALPEIGSGTASRATGTVNNNPLARDAYATHSVVVYCTSFTVD